jgi:regulator of protease activity HflC (stomatin/prohibitin superfamily)
MTLGELLNSGLVVVVPVLLLGLFLLSAAIKVVQEYERGVIFRLGRLVGARGPGLICIIPGVERMVKIDLRTITLEVPAQEAITRDNVTVRVNAVVYFKVLNPEDAVVKVLDYMRATSLIAQTTLRSVLGQSNLDELLTSRDRVNRQLQQIIDEQTGPWGVKVSVVEVRDLELPQTMQRAMARQAEAEREKRAKIIHAQGEFEAAAQLSQAAAIIGAEPATLQLRYLQTLTEVAAEHNSTIIFPVPVDLLRGFFEGPMRAMEASRQADAAGGAPPTNGPGHAPGADKASASPAPGVDVPAPNGGASTPSAEGLPTVTPGSSPALVNGDLSPIGL